MEHQTDELLQRALALPESERARLVEALILTFGPEEAAPLDDAWLAEISRRSDRFDAGEIEPVPWEEVKERARRAARSRD